MEADITKKLCNRVVVLHLPNTEAPTSKSMVNSSVNGAVNGLTLNLDGQRNPLQLHKHRSTLKNI